MTERVHIGMPVYNGATHLAEAIESLLNQTHKEFELFVVDNASTDATPEIIRRYEKADSRVHHLRHEKWVNATENFNRTYDFASPGARYFMCASHDDIWANEFIESLLPPILNNNNIVLSFPKACEIDIDGRIVGSIFPDNYFKKGKTVLQRIRSLFSCGKYSAIYGIIRTDALVWEPIAEDTSFGGDLWFLIRLATIGNFYFVKKTLFYKRKGGMSSTGSDPSVLLSPQLTWNIDEKEWSRISRLNISKVGKLYLFYRLKLNAKIFFPMYKKVDWWLLPFYCFLRMKNNPRSFGIRSHLRNIVTIR